MVIRGYIDLVFRLGERFYIADWKSNRLSSGYGQASMTEEMAAAGYDLQAQLYAVATLRWLKQRMGTRFDPPSHFGGVLYLFIRGMKEDDTGGVYFLPPSSLLPVKTLERSINERIAGSLSIHA